MVVQRRARFKHGESLASLPLAAAERLLSAPMKCLLRVLAFKNSLLVNPRQVFSIPSARRPPPKLKRRRW